jgi:hypothetical protein
MFVAAFLMLFVIVRLIVRLAPRRVTDDALSRTVVAVRT